MAYAQGPYRPQDPARVQKVVETLSEHTGKAHKGSFSCRSNVFPVVGSNFKVTSWKLQDWDYKRSDLPTYARGLFTYKNSQGQHEIAVRGYDKFFNHGEVRSTEWPNVEKNTVGPYELSVKENGCILFISGLEDGTLLVCSKHSTGPRTDVDISHASAGERWVDRHLSAIGKTRKDLALQLRNMNATAVAELCDDAFEEHVLAYTPDIAGIYLHGINLNLPEFVTYPAQLVDQFAETWGFKKTMHIIENDIARVKSFLDEIAETGNYAGRDTEGFVIRCRARDSADAPYHDWFFKYKFEEPYLMYRQWRECTKAVVAGKEPKIRKHKAVTQEYLKFAKRQLALDPNLGPRYNQNHGIIKLRDDFLKEIGARGSDLIKNELQEINQPDGQVSRGVILVPIATIGCGKTTLALALAKLFGWGHVQNDNITGKARPPRFVRAISELLNQNPVVIADRNNHQKRERKQLIEDLKAIYPDPKFVALHYVHDRGDYDLIRRRMRERIFSRGDNHQTIHAGSKGQEEIIEIMEGFMHRFEPLNVDEYPDEMFDEIIDLDVAKDTRQNLERVVATLQSKYPHLFSSLPSATDLDDAINWALHEYKPDLKHSIANPGAGFKKENVSAGVNGRANAAKTKQPKVEYYGAFLPSARVLSILEAVFRDVDASTAGMYRQLQQDRRIQQEFHVTLIHRASAPQHAEYWDYLDALREKSTPSKVGGQAELGKVKVLLERIVWSDRVMCMVVRLASEAGDGQEDFKSVNAVAHMTIGTANEAIKPKESNDLLQTWLQHGSEQSGGISDMLVKGYVELPATVMAVMQKR